MGNACFVRTARPSASEPTKSENTGRANKQLTTPSQHRFVCEKNRSVACRMFQTRQLVGIKLCFLSGFEHDSAVAWRRGLRDRTTSFRRHTQSETERETDRAMDVITPRQPIDDQQRIRSYEKRMREHLHERNKGCNKRNTHSHRDCKLKSTTKNLRHTKQS